MSSNVALRRTRRLGERRQAMGQGRRLEVIESDVGALARRAAQAPIRLCLLQADLEGSALKGGVASVVLARGRASDAITAAVFLIDTYCFGIKHVFIQEMTLEGLAKLAFEMSNVAQVTKVAPAYARKLLRDAAAWAAAIGFKPHRDFAAIEQVFGDVEVDAAAAFTFGLNGKPFYAPEPTETRVQARQRFAHLLTRLGEGGFDYMRED